MFVGPIVSGYGTEKIGYYGMNCVLGSYRCPPCLISSSFNANITSGDVRTLFLYRLLEFKIVCASTVLASEFGGDGMEILWRFKRDVKHVPCLDWMN